MPARRAGEKRLVVQHADAVPPADDRDLSHRLGLNKLLDLAIDRVLPHLEGHAELYPPLPRTASMMRSQSSSVVASGFWHRIALPAAAACSTNWA